jgi:hypothetical protein
MLPPVFLYQYHAYNQVSLSNFCLTQRYSPVSEGGAPSILLKTCWPVHLQHT